MGSSLAAMPQGCSVGRTRLPAQLLLDRTMVKRFSRKARRARQEFCEKVAARRNGINFFKLHRAAIRRMALARLAIFARGFFDSTQRTSTVESNPPLEPTGLNWAALHEHPAPAAQRPRSA